MTTSSETFPRIVLVGNPNVGKSVLFNALTGAYTTVSNYPGTSVEISKGFTEAEIKSIHSMTSLINKELSTTEEAGS